MQANIRNINPRDSQQNLRKNHFQALPFVHTFSSVDRVLSSYCMYKTKRSLLHYLHILRMPPDQNLRFTIGLRPPRQNLTLQAHGVPWGRRQLPHRPLLSHRQQLVLQPFHDPWVDEIEHTR